MEKELPIPYYLQVAETIRSRIAANQYLSGDLIPSYQQLEEEFRISNTTVRKAVDILVRDGAVSRRPGIGMVVAEPDTETISWELTGNLQSLRDSAEKASLEAEVLDITIVPAFPRVRRVLSLDRSDVWQMRKIRRHDRTIMAYYLSYSDPLFCSEVTIEDGKKGGFADVFRRRSGLNLTRLEQKVEAAVATLDLAEILKVTFGAPLLFVENIYYSTEDKPVLMTDIYYRGDRNSYRATIAL
jgi:GntR family transcriptional regulator